MDSTAIQQIQQAEATTASNTALAESLGRTAVMALHKNFELTSLEQYLPNRQRFRGRMTTSVIDDFVRYVKANGWVGSTCFINPEKMTANAIFNLGNHYEPGHADFTALLKLDMTAEYKELLKYNGQPMPQKVFAEWAEDWRELIAFHDSEGSTIPASRAISAIRRLTIESVRKENHEVGDFNASRSALESIEAKSDDGIPAGFKFTCNPYNGLPTHYFQCRVSILKGGEAPRLTFRVVQLELETERLSEIFMKILDDRFVETDLEIYRGDFAA